MGVIPWTAALYSFAGARDGHWTLWQALANEAHRLARRENWAPYLMLEGHCKRRFYREELAELVLTEDTYRHYFLADPLLYCDCMEVPVQVWEKQLVNPFRSLKGSYERWLDVARSSIKRWMRAEEPMAAAS